MRLVSCRQSATLSISTVGTYSGFLSIRPPNDYLAAVWNSITSERPVYMGGYSLRRVSMFSSTFSNLFSRVTTCARSFWFSLVSCWMFLFYLPLSLISVICWLMLDISLPMLSICSFIFVNSSKSFYMSSFCLSLYYSHSLIFCWRNFIFPSACFRKLFSKSC